MTTFIDNGVEYHYTLITSTTARIIPGSTGTSGALTIPQDFDLSGTTITITEIGDDAFSELATGVSNNITSVIIPPTVTAIGMNAFRSDYADVATFTTMSVLTSVTFAGVSQCTSIGAAAFLLTGISSIIIPASVTVIGDWCFYNIPNLSSVTFIESADWANGITIGTNTFRVRTGANHVFATIYIKDGQQINGTTYNVGNSYSLGDSPILRFTTYISTIISAPGYTSGTVSGTTFTKQNWIDAGEPTSLEIRGYERIGHLSLQNADTVTNVTFGPGVVILVGTPLREISELVSVTIGPDVTTIDTGFVGYASSFTTINLDSSNTTFHLDKGILYKRDGANNVHTLVQYPLGRPAEAFTIPDGVVIIAGYAMNTSNITAVHIPASVTSIGIDAFMASDITSVTFATNSLLTTIGDQAFLGTNITSINIPASVITIGAEAFRDTSALITIYIADGQSINGSAITSDTLVTNPYGHTGDVLFISQYIGPFIDNGVTYSYGYNSLSTIKIIGATNASGNIVIPATFTGTGSTLITVTEIGDYAFSNNTAISSVHIPASITSIGDYAFYQCNQLEIVTFATGSVLTTIGDAAFAFTDIFSINIPTSVTSLGDQVLYGSRIPPAPICFPAGTPVLTDQGEIAIEKIDPEKHTINTNKIEGITTTVAIENYVVMIKKDAFSKAVPCRDTIISANHKIMFNNQMIQAHEFVDKNMYPRHIYKIPYSGDTLYNVLLEDKHGLMIVNSLIAETLSPTSVNAWLFRKLKSDISNAERKEVMDAYMQRLFPAPVISSFMVGCK